MIDKLYNTNYLTDYSLYG